MATPRPFRFGTWGRLDVSGSDGISPGRSFQEGARRAEAQGYDWIVVSDHVVTPTAPISMMMAMAAATTTLRVSAAVIAWWCAPSAAR